MDIPDSSGKTALHVACQAGDLEIARMVFRKTSNMQLKDLRLNMTFHAWRGLFSLSRGDQGIHLAARNGHLPLVSEFVSSGCSLSSPGQDGNTVLHCAAQTAQLEVVKFCLAKGVDPDCENNSQETPLHLVSAFFSRGLVDHQYLVIC